jgi:precorrin-6A synthase
MLYLARREQVDAAAKGQTEDRTIRKWQQSSASICRPSVRANLIHDLAGQDQVRQKQTKLIRRPDVRHIYIIGIGTGNPEHVTIQAINRMNAADMIFLPTKGAEKEGLAAVRREICDRFVTNPQTTVLEYAIPVREKIDRSYVKSVDDWHATLAETYTQLISGLPEHGVGAFLVWGDPSLYDSVIRIVERARELGTADFDFSVVPGITSIQALAASHRIPINMVGKPVEITTGRRLVENGNRADSTIVMLDGEQAFSKIDDPDAEIFWGAYLGTDDEIVRAGRLADVADDIARTRAEARARHGWIMDIYLLRKGRDFDDL